MTTYNVRAVRWERGWELHIEGVGVTQSHGLGDAEGMVRDYLHLEYGQQVADSANIVIAPEVSDDLDKETADVRRRAEDLRRAGRELASASRILVRRLKRLGLTGTDIAKILDVSPQRVSQLLRDQPDRKAS
ncbi:hypothetical protein ABZV93_03530 [Actinopolymorpha sp. NPDC004070]|uniref:hypothetical protein n=1 Tax=Actinopolymorpha sp. NPDC004070 TaxID=3154548 RepID=UPI0033BDF04C